MIPKNHSTLLNSRASSTFGVHERIQNTLFFVVGLTSLPFNSFPPASPVKNFGQSKTQNNINFGEILKILKFVKNTLQNVKEETEKNTSNLKHDVENVKNQISDLTQVSMNERYKEFEHENFFIFVKDDEFFLCLEIPRCEKKSNTKMCFL